MSKLKRTTEQVSAYFKEQGCELLDEYFGCMIPMDYKCVCGCYGTTTWNNFTKGKRCGNCTKYGLCKKRSLADVKKMFIERGCKFLDEEFKGIHHKHNYICKCGRKSNITLAGFHHQNQYCRDCAIEKNKGSGNPSWRADRDKLKLEKKFRKKCYKALQSSLKSTGREKIGRTSDMLGYGPKELQEHITRHPSWEDIKDGNWHIDHIWPIKAFTDYGIADIALINNLDNLRPVTQVENNKKSYKYDKIKFESWLKEKGHII